MNYQESIDFLDGHIGGGVKPGLDRISSLLDAMGSPHEGYSLIHVAGTNGKTSTTRMATILLGGHGLSTGTFTSPHLQDVRERFAFNGVDSTEEEFALAISDVAVFANLLESKGHEPNTYFELTTAGAFAFFADKAVNAAVVEVGLGGRLDATNVIDADVCVVTGIGIDHTEFLGTDIRSIAREKLGIVGPSAVLVTGDLPEDALDEAVHKAKEMGVEHRMFGRDYGIGDFEQTIRGWNVTIEGAEETYEDLFLPVHGRHQIHNLAVAIAATEALFHHKLDNDAVREALLTLTLPGRMEPVAQGPLVLLDGAHNSDGIGTLVESLVAEYASASWQVVLGIMGDKDVEKMLDRLAPVASAFVVTAPQTTRAMAPSELADSVVTRTGLPALAAESVEDALDMARAEAGQDGFVLVTGSLYLVGEARGILRGPRNQ